MDNQSIYRSVNPIYINEETAMGLIPVKFYKYLIFNKSQAYYLFNSEIALDFKEDDFKHLISGHVSELNDSSIIIDFLNYNNGQSFQFRIDFSENRDKCVVNRIADLGVIQPIGDFFLQRPMPN